jgi:hypothetical protein
MRHRQPGRQRARKRQKPISLTRSGYPYTRIIGITDDLRHVRSVPTGDIASKRPLLRWRKHIESVRRSAYTWSRKVGGSDCGVMWAITSYFNPAGYKRRLLNYRVFRSKLSIPLIAVELSFDGQFDLTKHDADILIQVSGGAVLWQKERLLNIALKSVPRDVENVAWLDCDVVFERKDWAEDAEKQLEESYNIIQLFSEALYLKKESPPDNPSALGAEFSAPGIVHTGDPSLLSQGILVNGGKRVSYQPGLAWAVKRSILDEHYLYDAAIVGGGDNLMVASIFGEFERAMYRHRLNPRREQHFLRWAVSFNKRVATRIGNLSGAIYHLWHGEVKDRNYGDRHNLLENFDPYSDIQTGRNGAWQWTKSNTELEEQLRAFFFNRREDG